jgi:hypothetical protein
MNAIVTHRSHLLSAWLSASLYASIAATTGCAIGDLPDDGSADDGSPQAAAGRRATVEYTKGCYEPNAPGCARQLIFVNNPELLIPDDFADNGTTPYSLYTLPVRAGGTYRDFAEHINDFNQTGRRRIGYALFFYNPTGATATVTIKAKSGGNPCAVGGGTFFADVFSNHSGPFDVRTVPPGGQALVALTGSAPDFAFTGGCVSSVADFDVAGSDLTLHHIVYSDISRIAFNASGYTPQGYITTPNQTARYYKGLSPDNAVSSSLSFTLRAGDVNKAMPVRYREYTGNVTDNVIWPSNIDAGHRANAIDSDLVTFTFQRAPGAQVWQFGPRSLDGFSPPKIANLGNWGVVYKNQVTVTNPLGEARTIELKLIPALSSEQLHLAYFDPSQPQRWQARLLDGRTSDSDFAHDFTYATCTIQARTTSTCTGYFVIGGPSTADLGQYVWIR